MSEYRADFLDLALECGAVMTGKPDGSEPITIVFSIEAWRSFDLATSPNTIRARLIEADTKLIEGGSDGEHAED